jgi:hypothetical protein
MQAKVSAGQVIHDDCFTPERHVRRKKQMSALGQKRTSRVATRSSVFGGCAQFAQKASSAGPIISEQTDRKIFGTKTPI